MGWSSKQWSHLKDSHEITWTFFVVDLSISQQASQPGKKKHGIGLVKTRVSWFRSNPGISIKHVHDTFWIEIIHMEFYASKALE